MSTKATSLMLSPLFVATIEERKEMNIRQPKKYINITPPRRFGKSLNAYMFASYFMKGIDRRGIFDKLAISKHPLYESHISKHDVVF